MFHHSLPAPLRRSYLVDLDPAADSAAADGAVVALNLDGDDAQAAFRHCFTPQSQFTLRPIVIHGNR